MTAEDKDRPVTVGIDFGGDGLRVAADRGGSPTIVAARSTSTKLPRVIRFQDGQNGAAAGYRVLSLKRIMDFDEVIRSQIAEINTLEYVTQLFRAFREDEALKNGSGGLHVLGAIPPCFSQRQRSALRTALTEAGFNRAKLLDDSLAALLGSWDHIQRKNSILVYSWGASTFCASLYRPTGTGSFSPVIAPEGDRGLGGDDIDSALLAHLDKVLSKRWEIDFRKRSPGLFNELERVKLALARGEQARISLSTLGFSGEKARSADSEVEIPREVLDEAVAAMVEKTLVLVEKVLNDGKCPKPDAVLLVGGTTQLPEVRRRLENRFPGRLAEAADNAVALGAVVHGHMLSPQEWEAAEKRQEGPPRPNPDAKARPASPPKREMHADAPAPAIRTGSWAKTLDLAPLLDRAEAAHGAGRVSEAVETLESAHGRLGEFTCIVYFKAASDLLSAGDSERAFPLLQKANRLHPANRDVAWTFAELCIKDSDQYFKKRKYREAWGCAYEAVTAVQGIPNCERQYPRELAACLYREACILSAFGRSEEAEEILLRCAKLSPEQPLYAEELARLRGPKRRSLFAPRSSVAAEVRKVGRNDPCPCGSGEKYKKCHGR